MKILQRCCIKVAANAFKIGDKIELKRKSPIDSMFTVGKVYEILDKANYSFRDYQVIQIYDDDGFERSVNANVFRKHCEN